MTDKEKIEYVERENRELQKSLKRLKDFNKSEVVINARLKEQVNELCEKVSVLHVSDGDLPSRARNVFVLLVNIAVIVNFAILDNFISTGYNTRFLFLLGGSGFSLVVLYVCILAYSILSHFILDSKQGS